MIESALTPSMKCDGPFARARRRFCLRLVAAMAVLCVGGAPALARAADDQIWGTIRIPGGAAAMRKVAGLGEPSRPPTDAVRDLVRAWFGTTVRSGSEPRERFIEYLRFVARAESAFAAWPDGVSLAVARNPQRRDAFRDVVELMGLRSRDTASGVTIELDTGTDAAQRRRWLAAAGTNATLVAEDLSAGKTVQLTIPASEVPLPLPELFRARVFQSDPPLERLAASPEALLMYLGVTSLDQPTLAWLAAQQDVFRRLMSDRAAAFAAFGHAWRVRDGVVVVPGGSAARETWEGLVDASVSAPDQFLFNLLERQDGRLAHMYATAAACEPARQAFMLGLHLTNPGVRRRHAEVLRDWFATANAGWSSSLQPLFRPQLDPALVLMQVDLIGGAVGPDWWPSLFARIARDDGWPSRPQQTLNDLEPLEASSTWLLSYVFETPADAERRFKWIRYAQRMFPSVTRTAAPDIEIALRALKDMPALALALERVGERDPATLASLARAYRRVTEANPPGDSRTAIRAWQGALAVLEQRHRHRPLTPSARSRLLQSLAAAIPVRPSDASGAAAEWLITELLPALSADVTAEEDMEPRVFRQILASPGASGGDAPFTWEGVPYRIDWSGPVAASAARLRAVMPGARLEHLIWLASAARALAATPENVAAIESVARLIDRGRVAWPDNDLESAVRNLRRISSDRDRARATRERDRLLAALDGIAAELLPGWAYALAMSPTQQAARLFGDAPRLHRLSARENAGPWEDYAWQLASGTTRTPDGAAVRGSLLGLDLARAEEHLARAHGLAGRPVSTGSAIHELTVRALVDRIVLRAEPNAWAVNATEVAGTIARGRQRLEAKLEAPPISDPAWSAELSGAGVSQWRQHQITWLHARGDQAGVRAILGVTDYWRLGASGALPRGWGQSERPFDGCWCALGVDRAGVERFSGYTSPYSTVAMPDLLLRLAELASDFGLPSALIEPLLPMATQDLLDQVAQFVPDDWQPMLLAGRLTAERFEDYLNRLVTLGILAPPAEGTADNQRAMFAGR